MSQCTPQRSCVASSCPGLTIPAARLRWFPLIPLAILIWSASTPAQPLCVPRLLTDTAALNSAGFPLERQGDKESELRACINNATPPRLIVFRNGTQIGELDSARTQVFLRAHPDFLSGSPDMESDSSLPGTGSRSWAGRLWGDESLMGTLFDPSRDARAKAGAVVGMGTWPTGVSIVEELELAGSRVPVYRNSVKVAALLEFFHVYAGLGYHGSWFSGQTVTVLDSLSNNYRNHAFSFTAGLPFIRYELKHAGWIVPEYFWLEDDMTAVMDGKVEGRTLTNLNWNWPSSHAGNGSHAFYLHAGHLYLDLLFDADLYTGPIVRLSIDELPTVLGIWGASLTKAADTWIPGVWLQLPDLTANFLRIGGARFPVTAEPLRIKFQYWNLRRYQFGGSLRINVGFRGARGANDG